MGEPLEPHGKSIEYSVHPSPRDKRTYQFSFGAVNLYTDWQGHY